MPVLLFCQCGSDRVDIKLWNVSRAQLQCLTCGQDAWLELSAYFKFIELIEKESAALSLPKKQTWKVRKVDEKILRILKANFFLLLYNLVEASIREGFLSVYKAVEADGCSVSASRKRTYR